MWGCWRRRAGAHAGAAVAWPIHGSLSEASQWPCRPVHWQPICFAPRTQRPQPPAHLGLAPLAGKHVLEQRQRRLALSLPLQQALACGERCGRAGWQGRSQAEGRAGWPAGACHHPSLHAAPLDASWPSIQLQAPIQPRCPPLSMASLMWSYMPSAVREWKSPPGIRVGWVAALERAMWHKHAGDRACSAHAC